MLSSQPVMNLLLNNHIVNIVSRMRLLKYITHKNNLGNRFIHELKKKMPSLMPRNLNEAESDEIKNFVNSFDTVLSDCDGVLWYENDVIKDSENTMNTFRSLGKNVFFVTNNSTKTREEFLSKCDRLNFKAGKDEMVSTAYLVAKYLKDRNFKKKAYVIGSVGILKELDAMGIAHTDIGPDLMTTDIGHYVTTKLKKENDVGAVIVAFDEHFSYPKMIKASCYLNDPECLFIASNSDERVPVSADLVLPGTGSLIKCIETCSGRKAFVVGKPNDYIRDAVVKSNGIDPSRTLMIGDRSNTDISFGRRCGFKTLLVLSGVTTIDEVKTWADSNEESDKELVPDFYINKLGDLYPHLT